MLLFPHAAAPGPSTLALHDALPISTAGFRVFRATALDALPLTEIESQGYCFQVDMTWRVHRAGGRVAEVPISFVERDRKSTRLNSSHVASSSAVFCLKTTADEL